MRWSKLKKLLEALFDPALDLQIHCTVHRSEGGPNIGRYWFVLDNVIIWEEPKKVIPSLVAGTENPVATEITAVLREYLDTPKDDLLKRDFRADRWGLVDVLRAADRRVGKRRLMELRESTQCMAAWEVVDRRLERAGAGPG